MLAGVKFEEIEDDDKDDQGLHSERLDKQFQALVIVILMPLSEEIFFRALLQPSLSYSLIYCMPQLAAPVLFSIPAAHVLSAVAVGTAFGAVHLTNFKSGGNQAAAIVSVSGTFYGIIKECFGLMTSVSAHIVHNYMVKWINNHYPAFLSTSSKEK